MVDKRSVKTGPAPPEADLTDQQQAALYYARKRRRLGVSPFAEPYDPTASQTVNASTSTLAIDYSAGSYVIVNLSANVTSFAVSNWNPDGTSRMTLEIRNTGAFGITFPPGWLATGGIPPVVTPGAGARDIFVLTSEDSGVTVYIHNVGQNFSAI
jgi:hypothetical protein